MVDLRESAVGLPDPIVDLPEDIVDLRDLPARPAAGSAAFEDVVLKDLVSEETAVVPPQPEGDVVMEVDAVSDDVDVRDAVSDEVSVLALAPDQVTVPDVVAPDEVSDSALAPDEVTIADAVVPDEVAITDAVAAGEVTVPGEASAAGPGPTPLTVVPDPAEKPAASDRRRRMRTVAQVAAWTTAIVAVAVVLLVFVFPTRTYVNQRHQLTLSADQLRLLDQQNAQLSAQVARLQTDTEIERIAREQYHLVRPGESAFAILPAPTPATLPPPAKPVSKTSRTLLQRLTSWIP